MSRSAVIAGASGLVGGFCLQALLQDPHYERVIAYGRRTLPQNHPKLTSVITDFHSFDGFPDAADVFCALGTTIRNAGSRAAFRQVDFDYPKALAECAAQHGAVQFVLVSSVGAGARARNFYLRVKGETEREVANLPFRSVHLFRPSLLTGPRAETRPGERVAIAMAGVFGFALRGRLRRYRAIPAEIVGRAMVAAAVRGEPGVSIYEHDAIHWLASRR
jgi:uncharacterized protein YbjT (DUF2867 family)